MAPQGLVFRQRKAQGKKLPAGMLLGELGLLLWVSLLGLCSFVLHDASYLAGWVPCVMDRTCFFFLIVENLVTTFTLIMPLPF